MIKVCVCINMYAFVYAGIDWDFFLTICLNIKDLIANYYVTIVANLNAYFAAFDNTQ